MTTSVQVQRITPGILLLAYAYCAGVWGWAILHNLFGDAWWWLFLLNTLAGLFFLPIPLLLLVAGSLRRPGLWMATLSVSGLALFYHGEFLLPSFQSIESTQQTLTVMTYNVERSPFPGKTERLAASLNAEDADVIAFQELNPDAARLLQEHFAARYPFQLLTPRADTRGMGVISRFPIHPATVNLPGRWFRALQVLTLEFHDTEVILVNFHTNRWRPHFPFDRFRQQHDAHVSVLTSLVNHRTTPLIISGRFECHRPERCLSDADTTFTRCLAQSGVGGWP